MRRIFGSASIDGENGCYAVLLDGRTLRTPGRAALALPTASLAQAIADEWAAQGDKIDLRSMPMTALANAAVDLVQPAPGPFSASLAAYGESDLLCYRAPEADLAAEQARLWNPILNWAEQRWRIEFVIASGVMHVAQPTATVTALATATRTCDIFALAALAPLVTIGGSLVAALALINGVFAAESVWDALTIDERWQEDRWGAVDDAVEAREAKQAEWLAAARFYRLSRP